MSKKAPKKSAPAASKKPTPPRAAVAGALEALHEGRKVAAVYFPVAELLKWSENPRRLSDAAIQKVAAVIEKCGWGAPVIARASDKRLIAGHTRLAGAELLKMTEVPTRFMEVTDEQAEVLALADNRLNEDAEWNYESLTVILKRMSDDATRQLTGFEQAEIDPLLAADWTPPDLTLTSGGDDGKPRAGHPRRTIMLSETERAQLDDALIWARKLYGDEITESKFIVDLCARFCAEQDAKEATQVPAADAARAEAAGDFA